EAGAADLAGARGSKAVLGKLGSAFALPAKYSKTLETLYDCVTGMKPSTDADQPGFVVILQNLPQDGDFGVEERNALLDVFREAAEFFYDKDTAFRVFYSVARPS
ncbi:MAG: barstar family protein, partial [Quisquiliibacterium sp.]